MHLHDALALLITYSTLDPTSTTCLSKSFMFSSALSFGLSFRPYWPPDLRSSHPLRVHPIDSHGTSILGAQSFASAICTHIGADPDLTKTHTQLAIILHHRFFHFLTQRVSFFCFVLLSPVLDIGLLWVLGARTAKLWDSAFCPLARVPQALVSGPAGYIAASSATFVQPFLHDCLSQCTLEDTLRLMVSSARLALVAQPAASR